jgi:hypothetical protein
MLGEYFHDCGLGDWKYGSGLRGAKSHAWVYLDDLIVDITASQFSEVSDDVVVTSDSSWHQLFLPISGHADPARLDLPGNGDDCLLDDYPRIAAMAALLETSGQS